MTDLGPWVPIGNGRYRSQSTGRLMYIPTEDPAHPLYRKA
jgi:hypothetical protein